jgi:membrane protein DedA with SNARE-associated domain
MDKILYTYGYLAVFGLSFISSMGIPAGSEAAILGGGALASGQVLKVAGDPSQGHFQLSLVLVIVLATLGEVLGSLVGYLIGRYGGRPLVDRFGKYVLLTHKDLDRADVWFAKRGEPLVLFGRFIPLLRSFVSFAAGLGEMAIGKFVLFTVIGCAVWTTFLAGLGYSLGSTWASVEKKFSYAGYVAAVLFVVLLAFVIYHRVKTLREERAAAEGQR